MAEKCAFQVSLVRNPRSTVSAGKHVLIIFVHSKETSRVHEFIRQIQACF